MFEKLAFWKKKEDDFGLGELDKSLNMPMGLNTSTGLNTPTGIPSSQDRNQGFGSQPYSQPQQNSFSNPSFDFNQQQQPQQPQYQSYQQDQGYTLQKDVEVISIKLDAIKAAIESISQRLANLERFAYNNSNNEQPIYPRQYYREPPRSY
jgi:hypothetical protein